MAISRKAGFFSAKLESSLKILKDKYKQENSKYQENDKKNESVDFLSNEEEAGSGLENVRDIQRRV